MTRRRRPSLALCAWLYAAEAPELGRYQAGELWARNERHARAQAVAACPWAVAVVVRLDVVGEPA